jgi:hypothetical protein
MAVFAVRNLSDIRRKEIIKGNYDKHWKEFPQNVYVEIKKSFCVPTETHLG